MAQRPLDTSETPEQERAGYDLIRLAGERVRAVEDWWSESAMRADADSQIEAVNVLTPYTPLEHQVRDFINVSIDNLRTVVMFIEKVQELPISSLYSMVRSAVEASSYGVWMLKAGRLHKRAFYSLRLAYENNEDLAGLEHMFTEAGQQQPDRERVRRRLLELQQQLGSYRTHDITRSPTITSVVAEADRHVQRFALSGLHTWKTCSGVAHANGAVLRAVLERIPTGERDERGSVFTMRSRATLIAVILVAAVENLETLRELYVDGSAPDPGIRRRRPPSRS